MTMTYRFKEGAHLYGDAQAVGTRLEAIRKKAGLTPAAVVANAAKPASVLHSYFEWDDKKAAGKYRLDQAGHLIRCVTVVMEEAEPESVPLQVSTAMPAQLPATEFRAFMPVQREGGERVYESTGRALGDAEYRRQILTRAHAELGNVARKYRELKELSEVVAAIDRVGEIVSAERLPEAG